MVSISTFPLLHLVNIGVACVAVALSFLYKHHFPASAIEPLALAAGALFSVINLISYHCLICSLVSKSPSASGPVGIVLLKLPLLALLVYILSRFEKGVVMSAVAGFLLFVPAILIYEVLRQKDEG